MDTPEHKFEAAKVAAALGGAGGAKWFEKFHDPVAFFMGFSLADWAALLALIYSAMQISLLLPRWCRAVKGWFHGIF